MLTYSDVESADRRISSFIRHTSIFESPEINSIVGAQVFFKLENTQHIRAFKARGALNTLLWLKEQGKLPESVVAYSSGNHGQAVAWACGKLNVRATVYMPEFAAKIKIENTKKLGATVVLTQTRQEAEDLANKAFTDGAVLLPPFDHDQVICGQGTATYEALKQLEEKDISVEAVFVPCGGGGLASGTLLAAKGYNPNIEVIGSEPEIGNDVALSLKSGSIFRFEKSPDTIADGARTLSCSERTFKYLKQLDHFYEIPEARIKAWFEIANKFFEDGVEPTSAMSLEAVRNWASDRSDPKVLVIITGGNITG